FDPSMDRAAGTAPVVTISHGYWTQRFHNDPSAVGKTIVVNGVQMAIIGITPPWFTGEIVGQSPDLWLPMTMQDVLKPNQRMLNDRTSSWLLALGRLKPGVTLDQAKREIPAIIERSIVDNSTAVGARSFLGSPRTHYVASGAKGFSR